MFMRRVGVFLPIIAEETMVWRTFHRVRSFPPPGAPAVCLVRRAYGKPPSFPEGAIDGGLPGRCSDISVDAGTLILRRRLPRAALASAGSGASRAPHGSLPRHGPPGTRAAPTCAGHSRGPSSQGLVCSTLSPARLAALLSRHWRSPAGSVVTGGASSAGASRSTPPPATAACGGPARGSFTRPLGLASLGTRIRGRRMGLPRQQAV